MYNELEIIKMKIVLSLFFVIIAMAAGFFVWRKLNVDKNQSDDIRDLERRLTDFMTNQLKEIRDSQFDSSKQMHEQIHSFTK